MVKSINLTSISSTRDLSRMRLNDKTSKITVNTRRTEKHSFLRKSSVKDMKTTSYQLEQFNRLLPLQKLKQWQIGTIITHMYRLKSTEREETLKT